MSDEPERKIHACEFCREDMYGAEFQDWDFRLVTSLDVSVMTPCIRCGAFLRTTEKFTAGFSSRLVKSRKKSV